MEPLPQHLLTDFDTALKRLHDDLFLMASLARRALVQARQGLGGCDEALCASIAADDDAVDQLEKQVDEGGFSVISRFQPVAGDLRQVLSAMKAGTDLERIADEAVNISRKACKLKRATRPSEAELLAPLFAQATELFSDAVRAYVERNVAAAYALIPRDKQLDAAQAEVIAKLTARLQQDPTNAPDYLNLIYIARHLERVGDHAANIAEEAVYAVAARDVRHTLISGKTKVLFVCIHNSARSQMAEMWLKKIGGDRVTVTSAGLEPGTLNPLAVEVMREVGIDMSRNTTRGVFDLFKAGEMFHYVIAVCDKATAERCPIFPGIIQRLDWSFPDPAQVTGTHEEQLAQVRAIRDMIREKIDRWASSLSS